MEAEVGYNPPEEFAEESVNSLVDINLNDSTELWLIQLPENHSPDFDGQELSLAFHQDGQLGSIEGASGKLYNMLSYSSQESDATVFLSSSSRPRIAGKISRHVSLVHYPEPEELEALEKDAKKQIPLSSVTMLTNSQMLPTPSRAMSQRNSHSQSRSRSTHTSRKSSVSEIGDVPKPSKRSVGEPSRFSDHSIQDSGRGSGITISGSSEQSQRKKSKKKADSEA